MKKIVIIALIALCLTTVSKAQDYNTGIGLRAGYTNGLTVKHFIGSKSALEGILGTRWGGFEMTGLYELSNQAFHTDRLNWYIGFGGHVGFWDGNRTYTYWGDKDRSYTVAGIDGILGLEYNFREVPISLSIDWKPAMNIIGYQGFWGDGGALSIRYIF